MPMKNIIIIGAGGLAKELYAYIKDYIKKGFINDITIKGFLVDYVEHYDNLNVPVPYLGKIRSYKFCHDDYCVVAIGENPGRQQVLKILIDKEANFYSYIHSSCFISDSSSIDEGVTICPFSIVNADADIGKHCLINIYCSIGHDAVLGDFGILSPYSTINGRAKAGINLYMGTKATIHPDIVIGDNCIISAHSYVKTNKGNNYILHNKVTHMDVLNRMRSMG